MGDGPTDPKHAAQIHLRDEMEKTSIRVGCVYRHASGGEYVVLATSIDEEILTPLVTYYSIERRSRTTRTLRRFAERFTFLRKAEHEEIQAGLWIEIDQSYGISIPGGYGRDLA